MRCSDRRNDEEFTRFVPENITMRETNLKRRGFIDGSSVGGKEFQRRVYSERVTP